MEITVIVHGDGKNKIFPLIIDKADLEKFKGNPDEVLKRLMIVVKEYILNRGL